MDDGRAIEERRTKTESERDEAKIMAQIAWCIRSEN